MRLIILMLLISLFFLGCKKDKFDTAPQIKFKSLSSNVFHNLPSEHLMVTFQLTDKEGDFGFKASDSSSQSWVYFKPTTSIDIPDSTKFPDLSLKIDGSLDAEITADISSALIPSNTPGAHTDTLFFEIYVRDFARNKSNVIITPVPVYLIIP